MRVVSSPRSVLLVGVGVVLFALVGVVGITWYQIQRAVRVIHSYGGEAWSHLGQRAEYGIPPMIIPFIDGIELVAFSVTRLNDAELKQIVDALEPLGDVQLFYLDGTGITDRGVDELTRLRKLQEVTLANTAVTDAACSSLARLPELRKVWLDGTQISNVGLRRLAACPYLQEVSASNTQITDDGVAELSRKLPQLNISDD